MNKKVVSILKGVLLMAMLLKLSIFFDVPPTDFFPVYAVEASETEAESAEEDTGEEDEFIRIGLQWSSLDLVSSMVHGFLSVADQDAHIREIVPPPPQG
jgi:hypothetical protein